VPQEEGAAVARTVPLSTAFAKWMDFNFSGQGLKANDVVYFNVTPGAHGTDTVNVYSCVARYKGNFSLKDFAAR
jgi:hypothetical protein